jgi:type III secretion system FlhB-like substrate exporter
MAKRKGYSAEQIIIKLREAEVQFSQGQTIKQVCRALEVSEQTYYR